MSKLLLLLCLFGCRSNDVISFPYDKPDDPRSTTKTSPEFLQYSQAFSDEFNLPVGHIPISLGDLKDLQVGVCKQWKSGNRVMYAEIIIDREYYERAKYDHNAIEFVVYHELGHCALNLDHNNAYFKDGMPKSIMRSTIFSNSELFLYYEPQRDYYMRELGGAHYGQ